MTIDPQIIALARKMCSVLADGFRRAWSYLRRFLSAIQTAYALKGL